MMHRKCLLLFVFLITYSFAYAQEQVLYKQINTVQLFMEIHHPDNIRPEKKYPAIVFYYGGGWNSGSIKQFEPHAKYFSKRGIVCALVDYRVKSRQQTTPFEALKDAKSAIRYLRENAEKFHIDTAKIVAAGGSAGGHLAAALALVDDYDEITDNMTISSVPNALVLFNPVIDNGPGGYGYDQIGEDYKNFSPLHNIKKGAPPTAIFLGTTDHLIPVETVKYYQTVMEKVGSRCDLHLYEGQGHGFFNYGNLEYYKKTVSEVDAFLQSLGYLSKKPLVEIK